jgi:hypothetical protein
VPDSICFTVLIHKRCYTIRSHPSGHVWWPQYWTKGSSSSYLGKGDIGEGEITAWFLSPPPLP